MKKGINVSGKDADFEDLKMYQIPLNNTKEIALIGEISVRFYHSDGNPKLNNLGSVISMFRNKNDIEWLEKEGYLIIYEKPYIPIFGLNNK